MKVLFSSALLLLFCSACAAQQNDWSVPDSTYDTGAYARAELIVDGILMDVEIDEGSPHQEYDGTVADAHAWLDAANVSHATASAAAGLFDFQVAWEFWASTVRSHAAQTDAPEIIAIGETYHDAEGDHYLTANRSGHVHGQIVFQRQSNEHNHGGPEPQEVDGHVNWAIAGNTVVMYTYDADNDVWIRTGNKCVWSGSQQKNVIVPLPRTEIPGWRNLYHEKYPLNQHVNQGDEFQVLTGINSQGWNFANAIVSYLWGTASKTTDRFTVHVELDKEIHDSPQ